MKSEPFKAGPRSQSIAFDGSQFSASLFESESRNGIVFGLVGSSSVNQQQSINRQCPHHQQQDQEKASLPVKANQFDVRLVSGQLKDRRYQQQQFCYSIESSNKRQNFILPVPLSASSSPPPPPPVSSLPSLPLNSTRAETSLPRSSILKRSKSCLPPQRYTDDEYYNRRLVRPSKLDSIYSTTIYSPPPTLPPPPPPSSTLTIPSTDGKALTTVTSEARNKKSNQSKDRSSSSSVIINNGSDLNCKSSCSYCLPIPKLSSLTISAPSPSSSASSASPASANTVMKVVECKTDHQRTNGSLISKRIETNCNSSGSLKTNYKNTLTTSSSSNNNTTITTTTKTSSSSFPSPSYLPSIPIIIETQTTTSLENRSRKLDQSSWASSSSGIVSASPSSTSSVSCDQIISSSASNDTPYPSLSAPTSVSFLSSVFNSRHNKISMSPTIIKEVMKNMTNGKMVQINDEHELKETDKVSMIIPQINGKDIKSFNHSPNNLNNTKGSHLTNNEGRDDLSKDSSNESNDENDRNQSNQHSSLDKRPSKPPRKPYLNDSNGYEQQNDNLVEEIYLAAEPGPIVDKEQPKLPEETKSACNNLSANNLNLSSIKHFVVVAIDFGTTYSGYAFSFTRSPETIHMMRKWDDGCDPDVNNHKTLTILLLNPAGEFHAFGSAAREAYHGLSLEEAKEWFYFEKFKMSLHTTVNLTKQTTLTAANGKKISALTVFASSLAYFKNHALTELSEQCASKIEDEDVRWVVTVPALWRQTAKQFMRMAAYQAGLASPDNPSQLLISPEPEAAAIYCRKLKINQLIPEGPSKINRMTNTNGNNNSISNTNSTNGNLFDHEKDNNSSNDQAISIKKGTRYMVVDCGGGTVDITVHEIHDDLRSLKELHRATGCPFGSTGVDREFENLLEDIFGSKFLDDFRVKLPSGYVTLMTTFEGRKRATNTVSTSPYNIALPFSFIQSARKWKGASVDAIVKKYGSPEVSFDPRLGILRLSAAMMRKLFEPTCEKIVSQINSILESKNCCSGVCDETNLGYLFLVGGFAESQLLQSYIRSAFSSRLRVIIPQGVSSSILRGAVLFGLDPSIISVRRSKMTYGIGILNRFIHGYHPLSKLVVRDGVEWCSDIFDKFVLTDQSIATGDVVTRSYTPAKNGQKFTVLNIYCSERDDVRFITDEGVSRCGTLVLDLDDFSDYNDSVNGENCSTINGNNVKRTIKKLNNNQTSSTTTPTSPIIGDQKQRVNGKLKSLNGLNDDGNTADDDNSDHDNCHESRKKKKESDSPSTTPPPVPPPLPPPSLESTFNSTVNNSRGREIQTHMIFGDTEIKVTAVDVQSARKVRAEIDFLSQ